MICEIEISQFLQEKKDIFFMNAFKKFQYPSHTAHAY